MKLRLARKALAEAKRLKTRGVRIDPPPLISLRRNSTPSSTGSRSRQTWGLGTSREPGCACEACTSVEAKNHVYYAVHDDEIVVVSIWGAPKQHGPKL